MAYISSLHSLYLAKRRKKCVYTKPFFSFLLFLQETDALRSHWLHYGAITPKTVNQTWWWSSASVPLDWRRPQSSTVWPSTGRTGSPTAVHQRTIHAYSAGSTATRAESWSRSLDVMRSFVPKIPRPRILAKHSKWVAHNLSFYFRY
jgi:hypothetical protein